MTFQNFDQVVPKNIASVGVAMKWEVFDWGRKKNQLAEKEKTIEQARNVLHEAENIVLIEVGGEIPQAPTDPPGSRRRATQAGNGAGKYARFTQQIQSGGGVTFRRVANAGDAG